MFQVGCRRIAAAAMAGLLATWATSAGAEEPELRERATLLAAHLPDQLRQERVPPAAAVVMIGLGAGETGLSLLAGGRPDRARTQFAVAGGIAMVGGTAVLLVPENRERDTLVATASLSVAALWYGLGLVHSEAAVQWSYGSIAIGYAGTGVLAGLNLAFSNPPSEATLRADYRSVRTPKARAAIDRAQVRRIEQDFARTDRAIPPWAVYLPVALGGAVAAATTLDPSYPTDQRAPTAVIGAATLGVGLVTMLVGTPFDEYQRDLGRAGLSLRLGPPPGDGAGISVSGTF